MRALTNDADKTSHVLRLFHEPPYSIYSRFLFKMDVACSSHEARKDNCVFSMEDVEGQQQLVVKGKVAACQSSLGLVIPVCFKGIKDELQEWAYVS